MQSNPTTTNPIKLVISTFSSASSLTESPVEFGKPISHFQKPAEDSQLSTSFSSDDSYNSSRNPSLYDPKEHFGDTKYPLLTQSKISRLKTKTKPISAILRESEVLDSPVAEEKEEQEMENQFLKKLPMIADGEEFNVKKNHVNRFRGRENIFNREFIRCRSLEGAFLPLDSVQEDKNEEDLNLLKPRRKLLSLRMEDLNEFNQAIDRFSFERKDKSTLSVKMRDSKDIILEEQENRVLPHIGTTFAASGNGSRRSSLLNSPGPKLKVDEIDFLDNKKTDVRDDDSDESIIDTILEETEEKNGQAGENKEFQAAKAKLNEEREFLKKIVKGELIDEGESGLIMRDSIDFSDFNEYNHLGIIPKEDIIEEENNES